MAERRTLIEGMKQTPAVEPAIERDFVYAGKPAASEDVTIKSMGATPPTSTAASTRAPISTRIRSDYAAALKRASLERQLAKMEPHTISDILDEAL
ncbi:MAG: hypothetical protein Q8K78_14120, partial [Planctomycetaceae bacterium]|nr:hypothetical protein [Planctomycetaceae bacterium]